MDELHFAPREKVLRFQKEVHEIIVAIAPFILGTAEDADEWANLVFVTDESEVGDFLGAASECEVLAGRLGLPKLTANDSIVDVAARLRQKSVPN